MAFFLVTMTHPDGEGWGRHVVSHVNFLHALIEAGKIKASGPVAGLGKRAGFIIMTVDSREEVEQLIAQDPFAIEGLIDELAILAWDPMFGAFAELTALYDKHVGGDGYLSGQELLSIQYAIAEKPLSV